MARRIERHATRLSQVHESALDAVYAAGQRVQTIDGLPGRILFVATSFAPGVTEYEVQLDGGMGQGTYTASQLRPLPADYRAGHPGSNLPAGVTAGLEAEAAEVHLASEDYPEMGDVLHDRPDPGQQISVIGARQNPVNDPERFRTAADLYGGQEDPRDGDYNGGPNDTGVSWAAPAEQGWMHENEPPQEEAPSPVYDADTFAGNVMARLRMLEEAQGLFGTSHHATTINGTQIDDHGDAPDHGQEPRAASPDSYDGRSTEGDGDPKWSEPLPGVSKKDTNGAMVGMYPEGMSAGGGPSLPIGPFSASVYVPDDLLDHIRHVHRVDDATTAAEMTHSGLPAERYHDLLHDADEGYGTDWRSGAVPHERTASRVPWTGHERTELHNFDTGTSATDGDFVPSTQFTNRHPVSEQIEDPAPGVIEDELGEMAMQHTAASEMDWSGHLRHEHGYSYSDVARIMSSGNRPSDMHAAIHDAGLASHSHDEAPQAGPDLTPRFGPDLGEMMHGAPASDWKHARPERGGSAPADVGKAFDHSEPAQYRGGAPWEGPDRRRVLSMQAAAEHDAPSFGEPGDSGGEDEQDGTGGPSGTDSLDESPDSGRVADGGDLADLRRARLHPGPRRSAREGVPAAASSRAPGRCGR